jgi:hypothetical protein
MLCNISLLAGVTACFTPQAQANIVQNPGFETGDFTDWTINPGGTNPWIIRSGSNAFQGNFFAGTGCIGAPCITGTPSQQAFLTQTLFTTPGQSYTITFEFSANGNTGANEFAVLWNGTTVLDLGPGGTLGPVGTLNTYILYSVPKAVVATSTTSTLTFLGREDDGYDAIDNVVVDPTPEPATALVGMGLLPLALYARRRRR